MPAPDDIPLNAAPQQHLCWSCQSAFAGRPVSLSPDLLLPVCMDCWKKMTPFERISLAIQFADRDKPGQPMPPFGMN
jgi:hypothetical protein